MAKASVFIDTSVIISALLSSRGGSFYIIYKMSDNLNLQINEYVFKEAQRVLDKKFPDTLKLKEQLFLLIGLAKIQMLLNPSEQEKTRLVGIIEKDDAPIIASALKHSQFLVTLDNHFFSDAVKEFLR